MARSIRKIREIDDRSSSGMGVSRKTLSALAGIDESDFADEDSVSAILEEYSVDYSDSDAQVTLVLPGMDCVTGEKNVVVILRDASAADIGYLDKQQSKGQIEAVVGVISRVCVRWGSLPGVEPAQLQKLRAKHLKALSTIFAKFLT